MDLPLTDTRDLAPPADGVVLGYAIPAPRGRRRAKIIRGIMLALAILAMAVAAVAIFHPLVFWSDFQGYLGGGVMGTPAGPLGKLSKTQWEDLRASEANHIRATYRSQALLYFAIFLLTQWMFLCPRGSWRIGTAQDAPPGRRAAIAAGFIGMLLSIGVLATLMELPRWWTRLTTESGIGTRQHFAIVWIVMAALWAGWTCVFYIYLRSLNRYTALRRAFRWLIAGTILELVIAIPAHAVIVSSRGENCYCELGTYTGVAFGCTAALWLFGPGAFLLYLRERKRREALVG